MTSTEATEAPEEKCRLPQSVDIESITPGEEEGIKFGDTMTSRYEYEDWKSMRVS